MASPTTTRDPSAEDSHLTSPVHRPDWKRTQGLSPWGRGQGLQGLHARPGGGPPGVSAGLCSQRGLMKELGKQMKSVTHHESVGRATYALRGRHGSQTSGNPAPRPPHAPQLL